MGKRIKKLRGFLRDIKLAEQEQAGYTKCELWKDKWFKDELCPVINCSACIAKQALYLDNKSSR